jgi:hypothetical protein
MFMLLAYLQFVGLYGEQGIILALKGKESKHLHLFDLLYSIILGRSSKG